MNHNTETSETKRSSVEKGAGNSCQCIMTIIHVGTDQKVRTITTNDIKAFF